jgi:hypothetical protein
VAAVRFQIPLLVFIYLQTAYSYIYWVLGALSNNSRKLAILVGFYKCAQSAGQTVMWRIDALKAPYMNIFAGTWGLIIGALIIGAPVV